MIAALALAAALPPPEGTTFLCGAFTVGTADDIAVPAEDGRLFLVSGAGEGTSLEAVVDRLPASLIVGWRGENNTPVSLDISDIDISAGTAAYTLRTERNPASRLFTPVEVRGTCTLSAGASVTQDISQ